MQYSALFGVIVNLEENYQFLGKIIRGGAIKKLEDEFKKYIKAMFYDNADGRHMTWENYGEWHIDHKIPLASAKTESELISLCHYTNLQPLCSKVNRDIKKDNLEYEFI